MDDLNQFLNSVEASARRILKQQTKKQQELIARERAALVRAAKQQGTTTTASNAASSPTKSISRDELKASYTPGGALVIAAPRSPLSPSRRSEHDSDEATVLPRLPASSASSSGAEMTAKPSGGVLSPALPAIDHRRSTSNNSSVNNNNGNDAALEAVRKSQRERRAADKILNSPLYKSLARAAKADPQGFRRGVDAGSPQAIKKAIQEVDNVNLLLKRLGMRDNSSPTRRPEHAVERRMCNACWAQPHKLTGCEHHGQILPRNANAASLAGLNDEALMLRQMELQGPTSWLSDDLFVKYRSETERERLWTAYCRLKELEAERGDDATEIAVIPVVTRHPVVHKFFTQIELENLKTQAETRKRNLTKTYIFDVNHIWLTNLDHFNSRLIENQRRQRIRQRRRQHDDGCSGDGDDADEQEEECDQENAFFVGEDNALRDRRDEHAIRQGYCQIQSVSSSRALEKAIFPTVDQSTLGLSKQGSLQSMPNAKPGTPSPSRRRRRRVDDASFVPPLTLLVCGEWQKGISTKPDPLQKVPGIALIGSAPVLWWRYPHEEDPNAEYTKAIAIFARSKTLSSSNAILVSMLVAIDAPLLSPYCFAWHLGSKIPPPQFYEPPLPQPPVRMVSQWKKSLLGARLQTRLDALLPGTIMLLNPRATSDDLSADLDEPFGHRRFWSEHNRDAFRQWLLVHDKDALPPQFEVLPQPCSVQLALPNATGVGGRFCWHEVEPVSKAVNRLRRERDFVYIIANILHSGSNDPLYFAVSMSHEVMRDVSAAKLSGYLKMLDDRRRQQEYEEKLREIEKKIELGRLQLEARRLEQKRLEEQAQARAVLVADRFETDKMGDATLAEWEERLKASIATAEIGGWQRREVLDDQSHVIFYYALNTAMPHPHRFSWNRPQEWPPDPDDDDGSGDEKGEQGSARSLSVSDSSSTTSTARSEPENEDIKRNREMIATMTEALLQDETFLLALRSKLGLESTKDIETRKTSLRGSRRSSHVISGNNDDDSESDNGQHEDLNDQMTQLTQEADPARASLLASKMAKLQLPAQAVRTRPMNPGEGWKRLKVSKLPKNFARTVYSRHTEGPRSAFINQPNHSTPVGMIDPRESSPYDPPEFIPELRALFIPKANADLQEKKLQWAEFMASRPAHTDMKADKLAPKGSKGLSQAAKDALFERDPNEAQADLEQLVAKAIVYARNNNLSGVRCKLQGVQEKYGLTPGMWYAAGSCVR
ncbi:hypothetical protein PINS_up006891 [Pythium insidiosum]|nr:hypothetical protein PINS_up006891 [Pythium insidiosum]